MKILKMLVAVVWVSIFSGSLGFIFDCLYEIFPSPTMKLLMITIAALFGVYIGYAAVPYMREEK